MWKQIRIGKKDYFFQCQIDGESVKYLLYDLEDIWNESCRLIDVLKRAMDLNKRIRYDESTVLETIQNDNPSVAEFNTSESVYTFRLKYLLSGHPLNFEWKLSLVSVDEFRKTITLPMYMAVHFMSSQIIELQEIIRKKDLEIEQYKAEGAVLRRSTVATPAFNQEKFNDTYEKVNDISKGFTQISNKLSFQWLDISKGIEDKRNVSAANNASSSGLCAVASEKLKKSPKSKKRQFFEMRKNRIQHSLRAQKKKFEYTDSETPPMDELADIEKSLKELEKKRKADLQESTKSLS